MRDHFGLHLREFERDQGIGRLLDRLAVMELGGEFDNGFLVSSAGVMLRHYSHMASHNRPFALLPKDRRREALQDHLNVGLRPNRTEVELMLDFDLATASLNRTWNFHLSEAETLRTLMGALGKVLITSFNQDVLGLAPAAPDQKENPASVLYGGLFESSSADLKSQLLANLGTFVRVGSGPNIVHIYLDILRDALGHGAYALYIRRSVPVNGGPPSRRRPSSPAFLPGDPRPTSFLQQMIPGTLGVALSFLHRRIFASPAGRVARLRQVSLATSPETHRDSW